MTGTKLSKLPDGLPNIYAIIFQKCDISARVMGDICDDDIHDMNMEYIKRILESERQYTFNVEPVMQG